MQYVGSKNRLSKELLPIVQSYIDKSTRAYIEPFVGGANMIDKIQCNHKVGIDLHEELIELLKYSQQNELPETISEDEYISVRMNRCDYPKWYVGLVGFCGSFGAKYFGGFARRYNKDGSLFDVPKQAINSLRRQSVNQGFRDIEFIHMNFMDINYENIHDCVIYCDPPYRGTTKYSTNEFPYDDFYQWCRELSKRNAVLISEYNMPDDFECIWEKNIKTSLGSGVNVDSKKDRIEKLFTYSKQ